MTSTKATARPATPRHSNEPQTLTPESAASINDAELAFSTQRLLPAWESIPDEFKRGNIYTTLAEAIMFNSPFPQARMELKEGYTADVINRVVRAHLQSFAPKHEHKIAGVGYLISLMATVTPE